MELSASTHTLTSNGCGTTTDYSLKVKDEKTDIFLHNNARTLTSTPDAINKNADCDSKSLNVAKKEMVQVNCNNHASSGKKRKISEDDISHANSESTLVIEKIDTPNGTKQEIQYNVEENIEKGPSGKKSRNRRTLWIMSCDRCSFETDNMDEFTGHINSLHSNLNDSKCHKCSFSTTCSALLKKHDRYVFPYMKKYQQHNTVILSNTKLMYLYI